MNKEIEILESEKKFFNKNPHRIVLRLKLEIKNPKNLIKALINDINLDNLKVVTNLRGRPEETFTPNLKNTSHKSEELINVYGGRDQNAKFCYSLNTGFSKYNEAGQIEHSVTKNADGLISQYREILNLSKIFSWMPLKIEGFRLGFESYSSVFLGSMVGAVPSIDSRFYIESNNHDSWILIEKNKSVYSHEMLAKLDRFLNENTNLKNFIGDLKKQYEQRL